MNPFVYGERVGGDNFCNRVTEIKELTSEILNGQNIMIYSPRRFGKTSLMDAVLENLENQNVYTIYIDLYPIISNRDFIRITLKSISKLLGGNPRNLLKKVKTFFTRISPSLSMTVGEDGTPSVGINFDKTEILPAVEDVFDGLYRYVTSKKKKAVVVLDEFQQLGEMEDSRIEKALRGIVQSHREISYVFMGSKKHLIYDMFNNPARPFYKSSAHFPLAKIAQKDFTAFLLNKFASTNRPIDEDTVRDIVTAAESHPYYTQMLAHTVWEIAEPNQKIDSPIIQKALDKILEREHAAFSNLWDHLTLKQKRLLLALALKKEDEKIFSADFLERHNLTSSGTVQRGINSLINKSLIDKDGEKLEVNDVFLKLWLIKRIAGAV